MFWPFVFLKLYKDNIKKVVSLCIIIIISSFAIRFFLVDIFGYKIVYTATLCRLDGLLCGALLSIMFVHYKDILDKYSYIIKYVMLCSFCLIWIAFSIHGFGYDNAVIALTKMVLSFATIFYVSLLALVLLSSEKSLLYRVLSFSILRKVGRVSYGVYIFHAPIFVLLEKNISFMELGYWKMNFILFFAGTGISLILAFLSYRYFEKPILSLKDKYAPLSK